MSGIAEQKCVHINPPEHSSFAPSDNCLLCFRDIGIYSKTLQVLIKTDLKLFSVVYVVVFFAFSGGTFLSLRGATKYNATTGFDNVKVR